MHFNIFFAKITNMKLCSHITLMFGHLQTSEDTFSVISGSIMVTYVYTFQFPHSTALSATLIELYRVFNIFGSLIL